MLVFEFDVRIRQRKKISKKICFSFGEIAPPSIGFQVEIIQHKNLQLWMLQLPEDMINAKVRPLFRHYTQQRFLYIFIVDSTKPFSEFAKWTNNKNNFPDIFFLNETFLLCRKAMRWIFDNRKV